MQELICPICLSPPVKVPVLTPCQHLFCHDCITQSLDFRSCCPLDRLVLSSSDLKEVDRSSIIWKTWSKIQVECLGRTQGCGWIGSTLEYQTHAEECSCLHQPTTDTGIVESQHDLNRTRNIMDRIHVLVSEDAVEIMCL